MKAKEFKQYKRKSISEMRPYIEGEVLGNTSISDVDLENGSPKVGDMIARNPKNHKDQWLVAEQYFKDNLELSSLQSEQSSPTPTDNSAEEILLKHLNKGLSKDRPLYKINCIADHSIVLGAMQEYASQHPKVSDKQIREEARRRYPTLFGAAGQKDFDNLEKQREFIGICQWLQSLTPSNTKVKECTLNYSFSSCKFHPDNKEGCLKCNHYE